LSEFACICDAASPSRGAAARPASSARGHNGGRRICAGPASAAVGARGEGASNASQRSSHGRPRAPRRSPRRQPLPPPSGRVLALLLHGRPQAQRWPCSAVVLPGGGLQLPRHGDVGRRGEQGPPAGRIPAAAPPLPLLPPLPASSVCAAASAPEICRRATPGRRGSPRQRAAPPSRW